MLRLVCTFWNWKKTVMEVGGLALVSGYQLLVNKDLYIRLSNRELKSVLKCIV